MEPSANPQLGYYFNYYIEAANVAQAKYTRQISCMMPSHIQCISQISEFQHMRLSLKCSKDTWDTYFAELAGCGLSFSSVSMCWLHGEACLLDG